ncbi:Photosystem I reaction center subunit III [Oculatella sp. FACHB-28]|jgi:photosystem I subunit 3|uniref:Photosystem I reaction center subunit III n=1 Tax=Cyanophyceae TaxID=3028117 RepID=UPI0016840358|nr:MULTISPECIES: Photosystem I reaction center subunit III [Cyanophyceae]MBD1871059.1 Photosystem I reaction center subunit III [Cyanobacteria bacterium FACHB-471]MBD2056405.1 Photosystem I reaction center subunit III [Oculatella sp. FACHB-28]MBD2070759.1 Photosystem I reaction center subunit III [Leptolyngbya sp. FACHB-671]
MQRLFALVLVLFLWAGFAPPASADVSGLTPCADTPAFQQRASNAKTEQAKKRFDFYGDNLLCGPEGLPHLVVDGRLNHAGEFLIPGILFLYIAGLIGWSGRSYLISVRGEKDPEMNEVVIDVPRAIGIILSSLLWPLAAIKELLSGELVAKEEEIPISPR